MDSARGTRLLTSIDCQIYLAMFVGYAFAFHDSRMGVALFFGLFLLYLIADEFAPARWRTLAKFSLLALAIGVFAFGFTVVEIFFRHVTAPYLHVHDGLIQIEEATKFLLAGKNPYVENYAQTAMANWNFQVENLRVNPALYHNAYLPFFFIFTAPFYVTIQSLLGWFDGRMVFLPMFFGVLLILAQWVSDSAKKFGLLLFVSFNPFFIWYLIEGRNDIFVLFWIVLSVYLLRRRHETLSLVALGLACASKLTAWFVVPFFLLYVLRPQPTLVRWLRDNWASSLRRVIPLIGSATLIILPFFLWQPAKFVDDVWNYPNGASAFAPYPVFGYGFNVIAQGLGWLPSGAIRSPFEALQWLVGVPTLVLLAWRQLRNNTLRQMWYAFALLLAVMGFFSHVLNDNHIGFILTLFAIAALADEPVPPIGKIGDNTQAAPLDGLVVAAGSTDPRGK